MEPRPSNFDVGCSPYLVFRQQAEAQTQGGFREDGQSTGGDWGHASAPAVLGFQRL
jgi:hypothetical protein